MQTEIAPWLDLLKRHKVRVATALVLAALAIALAWVSFRWSVAEDRLEILERRAAEGFLQAPSSSRAVRYDPRSPRPIVVRAGDFPERVDLRFNAVTKRHARFRVSLVRADGTLVVHADNVVRDSNQDLRFSFNSGILPPGEYRVRVEGYASGGRTVPFAEARVQVAGPAS